MSQQFLAHPTHWTNKCREANSSYVSLLARGGTSLTAQRRDGRAAVLHCGAGTWRVEQGWVVVTEAQGNVHSSDSAFRRFCDVSDCLKHSPEYKL